jgi:hypothetical protein
LWVSDVFIKATGHPGRFVDNILGVPFGVRGFFGECPGVTIHVHKLEHGGALFFIVLITPLSGKRAIKSKLQKHQQLQAFYKTIVTDYCLLRAGFAIPT